MSKKVSYNDIQDSTIDWGLDEATGLPFSGQSVQKYIRKHTQMAVDNKNDKIEAIAWDASTMSHLLFNSVANYEEWLESGDNSLAKQIVPFQIAGRQKRIRIATLDGSTTFYYTTENTTAEITVSILVQSKEIADVVWEDEQQDTFVTVAIDRGNSGKWTDIVSNKRVPCGENYTVDVRNYLAAGQNRVRFTVVEEAGEKQESVTFYANLTSMYLKPSNFTWYTPFVEGTTYNLGGFNIGGNLVKTLKIKVTKEGYEKNYEQYLGTNTYITTAYVFKGLEFPTSGTGVYNVEIWLDANGLESDHLSYNIMCVASADVHTAQLVAISNVADKAFNFSDNTLFQYAIYNAGLSFGTPHIKLTSIVGATPTIIADEDLTNVLANTALNYTASLEVELEDENSDITLDALMTYGNEQQVLFPVDNSKSYPATTGASFYLNPSNRNNAQSNRDAIVNAVNGTEYAATFTRMAWVDGVDGWTTDESGRKCLLLPAMSPMEFAFQPLSSVDTSNGKTIEFLYKAKNVADYDEPIISIVEATDDSFRGIKITPKNILLHSNILDDPKNDNKQDYNTIDEEILHVVVSIIYNYKEVYGNLVQLYVNGAKVRSFEFENSDSWRTNANMILGNQTADFYLYKMRVYDFAFQASNAKNNYINSLPTTAENERKKAEMEAPVDENNALSYDECVKNGLNTMVIEILGNDQTIPNRQNQSAKQCNLTIDIKNAIEGEMDDDFASLFSGTPILNQTIEGQGTTAMTYHRWNFRWKLDSTYNKRRITAKKNVASSMHSHKMGGTRLFNDLNAICVGANDAGKRTAVYQYPVYGFQKILREGTTNVYDYAPIGLYTIGPDKGDKGTFGFDDERFESTLIHLEGTDHTPKGVGMDYPWSELVYSASSEGFGAVNSSGAVVAAWECGAAGPWEVGEYREYEGGPILNDSEEVRAMLDVEFKPAYEVAYNNHTFIEGTTATLAEMNADPNVWQNQTSSDGKSYSSMEFWTDGVYDLYYFNTRTQQYTATGVNLLTDLGLSESDVASLTIAEKNELFKRLRRERFMATWGNYWHKDDAIFHYAFVLIFGATDNFKKNTYPYKFRALADGGLYRWRQDDLDTTFDINNQGFATKIYSILVGDSTGTGSVYRGDNSYFWTLIKETQQTEIKAMVHKIFDAMVSLSPYGSSTLDKLVGCIRRYFWDFAQSYFPATAYNADAEWTYEDVWAAGVPNGENINPLQQSLGGHYEAERDWVAMRMLFMASYFNYGPFSAVNDSFSDTSTGQMAYGGAGAHTFSFTPAVDFNPTVLRGQSEYVTVGDRVKAGDTVTLAVPDTSGADTRIYVQGVDWMEDIGDLSTLQVSAENAAISVASKRLQRLKVGDEVADNVTSNISAITFGDCPSMMYVDARNLASLSSSVDLSKLPRLIEAYFGGTSVPIINIPNGSKIEKLQLSPALKQLTLMNLKFMSESGLLYDSLAKVESLRIEGCDALDIFAMLKSIYNSEGSVLRDIRVVGFDYDGDATDLTMIANLANDKDKDGNAHIYNGINSNGVAVDDSNPVLEGKLTVAGSAYEDDIATIRAAYPNLDLSVLGGLYVKFADPKVLEVLLANITTDDGIGLTTEDVEGVTGIGTWFKGNAEITSFDEFELFTGIKQIYSAWNNQAFGNCTSLEYITLPRGLEATSTTDYGPFTGCTKLKRVRFSTPVPRMVGEVFADCTSLTSLEGFDMSAVTEMNYRTFYNCTSLVIEDANFPNLTGTVCHNFHKTRIRKISDLGSITAIVGGRYDYGFCFGCVELTEVVLPSTLTSIGPYSFRGCTALEEMDIPASVTNIGGGLFYQCSKLSSVIIRNPAPPTAGTEMFTSTPIESGAGYIYVPDASVDAYKEATNWATYIARIKPLSEYNG